jgi:hypothetical protein
MRRNHICRLRQQRTDNPPPHGPQCWPDCPLATSHLGALASTRTAPVSRRGSVARPIAPRDSTRSLRPPVGLRWRARQCKLKLRYPSAPTLCTRRRAVQDRGVAGRIQYCSPAQRDRPCATGRTRAIIGCSMLQPMIGKPNFLASDGPTMAQGTIPLHCTAKPAKRSASISPPVMLPELTSLGKCSGRG